MNDHSQKGILFFGVFVLIILGLLVGAYFWYSQREEVREFPELTNALLINFPGSDVRFYAQLLALKGDTRLDHFDVVISYAKRGGNEVALVKEDIDSLGTDIVLAKQGGDFEPLYIADTREKRVVSISPSGAFIAYSYFADGLGEGRNYADVTLWRTAIVDVKNESVVREVPGYGLQFISDNVALIGGADGILSLNITSGEFAQVGVSFPTIIDIQSFAVNESGTMLVVTDLRGNKYHVLSIQGTDQPRLSYSTALTMDTAGIFIGVVGDSLVFGKSSGPNTPISIVERQFQTVQEANELFTTNRI